MPTPTPSTSYAGFLAGAGAGATTLSAGFSLGAAVLALSAVLVAALSAGLSDLALSFSAVAELWPSIGQAITADVESRSEVKIMAIFFIESSVAPAVRKAIRK